MSIIQIIILIFAIFALSRVILRFRDKLMSLGEFVFWVLIWLAVIAVSIYPNIISGISEIVGIGRSTDFAVYISIIVLFYLVFRIYVKMDEHEQRMIKFMREITIREHQKGSKRK